MNTRTFIIGVAGGTGSGKTTVAQAIINNLNHQTVIIIQHDSYYKDRGNLPFSKREKINYDHPDALETGLLVKHLKELISGRKVEIPEYNFTNHTRKKNGKIVALTKAIIVEGILIFTDRDLRELMDIKIFVDTDDDIRFIRRLQRDIKERNRSIESVIEQYLETVRPMHIEFVETSKKYADIIIPEGHNPIAIDMVVSMIKDKIKILED
jgi:uridine kinase